MSLLPEEFLASGINGIRDQVQRIQQVLAACPTGSENKHSSRLWKKSVRLWISDMFACCDYAFSIGQYQLSEDLARDIMGASTELLKDTAINQRTIPRDSLPDYEAYFKVTAVLATIHSFQGRWLESEDASKWILRVREECLGPENPETIRSKLELVKIYLNNGRVDAAVALGEEVLASIQSPGSESSALFELTPVVLAFCQKGLHPKAEEVHMWTMNRHQQCNGDRQAGPPANKFIQAAISGAQGENQKALTLYLEALETQIATMGPGHPQVLLGRLCLAEAYQHLGNLDEAENQLLSVQEKTIQSFGPDHYLSIRTKGCLSELYRARGDLDRTMACQVELCQLQEKNMGADHPATIQSIDLLTISLYETRQYNQAEQLKKEFIPARLRCSGADLPNMASGLVFLDEANVLRNQVMWKNAEGLLRQAWEENRRNLGKGHSASFLCGMDLAIVLRELNLLKEAEKHGRNMLDECEKSLAPANYMCLAIRYDLAYMCLAIRYDLACTLGRQGRSEEAERLHTGIVFTPTPERSAVGDCITVRYANQS